MQANRVALVTGANQGVGLQVAKELVANGSHTVLVGARNFARGEVAAQDIGPGAIALQLDVTDRVSIAAAAERIRQEFGRLDLLVNNAAISNTRKGNLSLQEYAKISLASNASLDEIRTVWETNVFGALAVYQAVLPLRRASSDARIVNVSSGVGSLTTNADPAYPHHRFYGPVYPASKAALNAVTLAMMVAHATAANRHDVIQLKALVEQVPPVAGKPGHPKRRPEAVLADRADDSQPHREWLWERGIIPFLSKRGEAHGSGPGAYRYVVERTFAWFKGLSTPALRYERIASMHEAALSMAMCIVCYRHS